jgi:hypothetical protein
MEGIPLRRFPVYGLVWRRDDQNSLGDQDPHTLVQEEIWPLHVLDRLKGDDDVDGAIGNGDGVAASTWGPTKRSRCALWSNRPA